MEADSYESVHGGFGPGVRNESREQLLHFSLAHDLVIENSIFRKKEEHLITYKSGGHATQIDYVLVRKGDRPLCRDCKVVLGMKMPAQYRLLVLVFRMRKKVVEKKVKGRRTTMWGKLKREVISAFSNRIKVLGYLRQSKYANQMWKTMADTIWQAAKEILGASTGKPKVYKGSWCWNEEVKEKIMDKNNKFKELLACNEESDRISKRKIYKEAK